jgi:hypothetical protein
MIVCRPFCELQMPDELGLQVTAIFHFLRREGAPQRAAASGFRQIGECTLCGFESTKALKQLLP